MHRILFLILMLSLSAFAYDNVYAWGYGEMLQNILDAIRFSIFFKLDKNIIFDIIFLAKMLL